MRRIKIDSDMLRRIEDALDERKSDRRLASETVGLERRRRSERRGQPAADPEIKPAGRSGQG